MSRLAIMHLRTEGSFGAAVSEYLKIFRSDMSEAIVSDVRTLQSEQGLDAAIIILVASRPIPEVCDLLDKFSHKWQRFFLPVIVNSTVIRLGPIVAPGVGGCWNCWIRRSQQFAASPKQQLALLKHYTSHQGPGPQGYLEPFAMMTAARIAQITHDINILRGLGGSIWEIDMLTRRIMTSTLIGVHDCPRCGLHRPVASRSYEEMRQMMSYLWTGDASTT